MGDPPARQALQLEQGSIQDRLRALERDVALVRPGELELSSPSAGTPATLQDLTAEELAAARSSMLPLALAKALHRRAVALGRDAYLDPTSGSWVFTSAALKRRPCCGNGCRHCPHGHVNVPPGERRRALDAAAASNSW
eukprot:scaffold2969_cov132-Isochrysis_galbana.AAC.2